jgi:hypothetical protein
MPITETDVTIRPLREIVQFIVRTVEVKTETDNRPPTAAQPWPGSLLSGSPQASQALLRLESFFRSFPLDTRIPGRPTEYTG